VIDTRARLSSLGIGFSGLPFVPFNSFVVPFQFSDCLNNFSLIAYAPASAASDPPIHQAGSGSSYPHVNISAGTIVQQRTGTNPSCYRKHAGRAQPQHRDVVRPCHPLWEAAGPAQKPIPTGSRAGRKWLETSFVDNDNLVCTLPACPMKASTEPPGANVAAVIYHTYDDDTRPSVTIPSTTERIAKTSLSIMTMMLDELAQDAIQARSPVQNHFDHCPSRQRRLWGQCRILATVSYPLDSCS
jgi:hypothetical protein